MDWDRHAEKFSSWFREEDEYMLNDVLNYEFLSCIPTSMEMAIRMVLKMHLKGG